MKCCDCKFFIEDKTEVNKGICRGVIVPSDRLSSECPQKSFQKRIDGWLTGEYEGMFSELKKKVQGFFREKNDQGLFTLHDRSHCIAVEKMEKVIVTKSNIDFSSLERFLLSCAAWTHDLGMNPDIADQYISEMNIKEPPGERSKLRRKEHHNISCWYIQKKSSTLFANDDQENNVNSTEQFSAISWALSSIIQFHRKSEDISTCEEWTSIKGEVVRLKLLAAILRLADTLHKDVTRFDRSTYAILKIANFGRISRLHWLKSFVVSNIHLSESDQTITVHLKLPDYKHFLSFKENSSKAEIEKFYIDWEQRVHNLKYIITTDIEEDLIIVNGIYATYKMPTYVKVNIDIAYIRGFSKDYFSDIDSVLSELDILFSPNTSKVISRTLDSLFAFSLGEFRDAEIFWSQFNQLGKYLKEIYDDRPCHAGLGWLLKIINQFNRDRYGNHINLVQNDIVKIVNNIKGYRKNAQDKICNKIDLILNDSISNIFVVGFSSTVMKVLQTYAAKKSNSSTRVNVYVMECSPKRRLVHSNLLEYNDGSHYATEIGKLKFFETKLIPDFGFATILSSLRDTIENESDFIDRCLVLFGANGIDGKSGDCGHTSGHLMVAITANEFKIPVKVISDSFKIGNISWNSNAVRKGDWFATQKNIINELADAHVEILNMREDRIPWKFVTEIHTEDDCLINDDGTGESFSLLDKLSRNINMFYENMINNLEKPVEQ